jgi:hypothetical protein
LRSICMKTRMPEEKDEGGRMKDEPEILFGPKLRLAKLGRRSRPPQNSGIAVGPVVDGRCSFYRGWLCRFVGLLWGRVAVVAGGGQCRRDAREAASQNHD